MTRRRGILRRAVAPVVAVVAACCAAVLIAACGKTDVKLTELQRVKSGTMDVVLLSPHDALRHGKEVFVIEFRSAPDGRLVNVGDVRGSATMPMPGMPMFGGIQVQRGEVAGRYSANAEFGMAGTWRLSVEWNGPQGQGAVRFSGTVQ